MGLVSVPGGGGGAGSLLCQDPNHGVTEGKQETLGRDGDRQAAAGTEVSLRSKHLSVMSWRKGVLNRGCWMKAVKYCGSCWIR